LKFIQTASGSNIISSQQQT